MPNIKVKPAQSVFDMAISVSGGISEAFEMCQANGIGLTDALSPGLELGTDPVRVTDQKVLDFYTKKEISIGTAKPEHPGGLGVMAIEEDFTVK